MADIRQTMRSVAYDLWRIPEPEIKKPVQEAAPAPDFEDIWKAVDEGTEWTAILADPAANPALAPLAGDVLLGDVAAYRAALDIIRPLDDLKAYYTEGAVEVTSSDMLCVAYTAAFSSDDRRRAAGLALRVARDLLAALPVTSINVWASHADGKVLEADFTRDMLRHIRVNVADPEEIAAQCGVWL